MPTAAAQARYPLTQGVNPWLVVVSVMLPTFMEVLDTAIASVALPYIAGSLSASNSEATWVLTPPLRPQALPAHLRHHLHHRLLLLRCGSVPERHPPRPHHAGRRRRRDAASLPVHPA